MRNEYASLQPRYTTVLNIRSDLMKRVSTFDKYTIALRNATGFLKDLRGKTKFIKDNQEQLLLKFKNADKEKNDM